ncbi:uncharacterized protein RJT21DRAFT_19969 [Scheffersomyces amazonensis]|uniref:uncharacterized protein n=1 Tax=Scheffersomyces amazonensis TaxID=1078765 RepID=UPI00315C7B79
MSGKPKTPISSPKPQTRSSVRPTTPPVSLSSGDKRSSRLSSQYLRTPEQSDNSNSIPFSPSLKRTNSGNYKSPDYKLNHPQVTSPYNASNLLKTPRHSGYDSDDNGSSVRRTKLQKTPQYFSSAKKLFQGDENSHNSTSTSSNTNKDDLTEISSQLKSKLSSALGKIQRDDSNKISFTELKFDIESSPTKKSKPISEVSTFSPSKSLQRANLNLQTLQQSPIPKTSYSNTTSPYLLSNPQFSPLKQSPILNNDNDKQHLINLPSNDEESSAHSALLAALSRQRRKSRSSFSHKKRPSWGNTNEDAFYTTPLMVQQQQHMQQHSAQHSAQPSGSHSAHHSQSNSQSLQPSHPQPIKLPPLNIMLGGSTIPGNEDHAHSTPAVPTESEKNNEQDAVLSLMSLSSPQSIKFGHSRNHSLNNNIVTSPISSRSSSVIMQSPINSQTNSGPLAPSAPAAPSAPILPPLSRLIGSDKKRLKNPHSTHDGAVDSDATDVDEDADVTDEEA